MDNQIKYTVSLQDQISGKLDGMNSKAKTFEGTLNSMKGTLGALGASFGILKIEQFIEGGIKKALEFNKAVAQVQAGIQSTGGVAGISAKQIEDMTGSIAKTSLYSKTQMMDAAAQTLSFTNIHKDMYKSVLQNSADVAARTGNDIHQVSIQMGKAFDNPMKGIMSLRRIGVTFSNEQIEQVKRLQAAGKITEAQQLMAIELNKQYGGSAEAAFNADPLAAYNKEMGALQKQVGEAFIALLQIAKPVFDDLMRGLSGMTDGVKEFVEWFKKGGDGVLFFTASVKALATILVIRLIPALVLAGRSALMSMASWISFGSATTLVAGEAAVAATSITASMALATAGISLVVAGLISAIYYYGEKTKQEQSDRAAFEDTPAGKRLLAEEAKVKSINDERAKGMRENGSWWGLSEKAKDLSAKFDKGKQANDLFRKTKGDERGAVIRSLDNDIQALNEMREAGKSMESIKKQQLKDIAYLNANKDVIGESKEYNKYKKAFTSLEFKPINNNFGTGAGEKVKTPSGAKGQNITTINIHIDSLVKSFSVNTTNLNESSDLIQEKVAMALTAAVNDSQIIK